AKASPDDTHRRRPSIFRVSRVKGQMDSIRIVIEGQGATPSAVSVFSVGAGGINPISENEKARGRLGDEKPFEGSACRRSGGVGAGSRFDGDRSGEIQGTPIPQRASDPRGGYRGAAPDRQGTCLRAGAGRGGIA